MVNDDNIDVVNLELIDVIKSYGLPFIEKYQNPDELLKCVEERKYILTENMDYDLPILYYLNGDKQKGLHYIEEGIERKKILKDRSITPLSELVISPTYLRYYENYKELK
jgi:hypothetical protein